MGEANDTANRMIKTGEGKAPTLTLDPDEVKYDMSFMEPSLKENMPAEETKAAAAGAVDESMLSEDEKKQVETFVKQIDISNVKLVNSYGASAQKGISGFSVSITKNVKTKDFGDIGDSLRELETAIKSTTTSEKKGLLGLFKKGKKKVASLIAIMKVRKPISKK